MKNKIKMFFHCKNCLNLKTKVDKGHLAVGWTPKGLQIWCENCDTNLMALDFEGQKVSYEKEI